MTSRQVFAISLKLLGGYSFIQSISLLQPFGMFASAYSKMLEGDPNFPLMYFAALLPSIVLLILAFVLLFYGDRIASVLPIPNHACETLGAITARDLQSLAFSVIGVVIVLFGIIDIVRSASSIMFAFKSAKDPSQLVNLPYTISLFVKVLFGVFLFLGAKPLAAIWHRLKYEWSTQRRDS